MCDRIITAYSLDYESTHDSVCMYSMSSTVNVMNLTVWMHVIYIYAQLTYKANSVLKSLRRVWDATR